MSVRAVSLLVTLLFTGSLSAFGQSPDTSGTYTDRDGKPHVWSVSSAHALTWDKTAYVPVGGVFTPRYLADSPSDENWTKDTAALQTLKSHGISDIIVQPVVSAVDIPLFAWQRLIDYLDANGFHYGLAFGEGISVPLTGIVVKPANYRIDDVSDLNEATWKVGDATDVYYVYVDPRESNQVIKIDRTKPVGGVATAPVEGRYGAGTIGLAYPRLAVKPTRDGIVPDLWSGFDSYRDRLITLFDKIKFGAGLRFFLDPFTHPLGISGDAECVIPDSPTFLIEWEAYLSHRYPSVDGLLVAWSIQDHDLKEFKNAAHLVPLWSNSRGVPFLFDPATGTKYQVKPGDSRFWTDFREFRDSSIAYYVNTIADILKQRIAKVPVVYTRTPYANLFNPSSRTSGFDGLGISAYARGSALVTSGADAVFSQCEETDKPLWCLVTETLDTTAQSPSQVGYSSQQSMNYDLDWLRGIGAKGFFVNGFQVLPETDYVHNQLVTKPEQLDWLKAYSDQLHRNMDITVSRPRVLPFPAEAAGLVHSGPIGNGAVWWVPSQSKGSALLYGSSYAGYTIATPNGDSTVLWSLRGARDTHLLVDNPKDMEVTMADGTPIKFGIDGKHHAITVMMSDTPLLFRTKASASSNKGANSPTVFSNVFPREAVEDAIRELSYLIAIGQETNASVDQFHYQLNTAQTSLNQNSPQNAYAVAGDALNSIIQVMRPYFWREAEKPDSHTFTEALSLPAASNGQALVLNTESAPGDTGFGASYKFSIRTNDLYNVWLACTPPGGQSSPFTCTIDSLPSVQNIKATIVGTPYLSNQFVWLNIGRYSLAPGTHTLRIQVSDKAAGTGRYYLAMDAICITPGQFNPNGITRPQIDTNAKHKVTLEKNSPKNRK